MLLVRNNPTHAPAGARRRAAATPVEPLERRLCLSVTFSPAPGSPVAVGQQPVFVAVGDFNADGIADLAVPNSTDNTVTVLLGNGQGGFSVAPGSPVAVGSTPLSDATGDFNGDGKTDLVVSDSKDNRVTVLLGNGNGTFTPAPGSPVAAGTQPAGFAVGDFNGDGKADLAVTNFGADNSLTVLLGNGAGGFTAAPPITGLNGPFHVVTGDFNGDGKTDLAVTNQVGNSVSVLLGNGAGGFTAAPGSPIAVGVGPYSLTTADFNGDGKADLAVANYSANTVNVLLGAGDGTFTAAPGSPVTVDVGPYTVTTADFNGDGKPDLATANVGGSDVSLLLGNGDGTFTAAAPVPAGQSSGTLAVADLNGDKEPDLVVANSVGNTLSVALNTTVITQPLPTGTLGAAVTAAGLPTSVVGGAKTKATATVTVTAPAGAPLTGATTVTLYASPGQTLTGATQLLTSTHALKLKAGAHKALRFKLPAFPSALNGSYILVAAVKGPDGTTTAVAGPSVTVAPPFVSIHASNVQGSPATVAPGKKLSFSLTLQNTGNTPASGTAALTISLSAGATGAAGQTVATPGLRVKLKPGQSKSYRVKFAVPAGTAPGRYYLSASLAAGALGDTTAGDGAAVAATPITVS